MAERMSYELSDGLAELRRLLADYQHEPRVLDPEDARVFAACLKEMLIMARRLENEVSRHRWNAMPDDSAIVDLVTAECMRPGSNVVALPGRMEIPFADGPWVGGSA